MFACAIIYALGRLKSQAFVVDAWPSARADRRTHRGKRVHSYCLYKPGKGFPCPYQYVIRTTFALSSSSSTVSKAHSSIVPYAQTCVLARRQVRRMDHTSWRTAGYHAAIWQYAWRQNSDFENPIDYRRLDPQGLIHVLVFPDNRAICSQRRGPCTSARRCHHFETDASL